MSSYHVQTLANSIIGTAILAMPYCFSKCGVVLSIILLIISTVITRSCCHYLIKASIVTRRRNMELLGFHIFGQSGKTVVELSVIGFLMGSCVAFYVVIGDLSPLIVSKIFNTQSISHDSLRKLLIILITVTTIIPLSFQKSIESLSFVCRASIGFYICLTLKTVFESFERFENDPNWSSNIELWNPSGVLQCIPIFSMAMSCQMQLFEVYETMSGSFDHIKRTVNTATSICLMVYCVVGFFGYLAFYNQTLSGNVLMNFSSSLANDAITIGFIMSIACSFPLAIFPCRTSLASFLHRKNLHSEFSPYVPESKYQPLTLFIIFSTMIVGILIPSVEVIISLVGSTIGILICVIFPATCFVKIMKRNSAEKTVAQIIIVVGFFIMILGTYSNFMMMDKPNVFIKAEKSIEHPRDIQKIIPVLPDVVAAKPEEVKISDDGIKKEELEIAADNVLTSKDPKIEIQEKNEEIQELKESKDKLEKEVQEMKEVLVKQNKETQKLVLQKFEEIAEKVDKIEKQSMDGPGGSEVKAQDELKVEQKVDELVGEHPHEDTIKGSLDEVKKVEDKKTELKPEPEKILNNSAEPVATNLTKLIKNAPEVVQISIKDEVKSAEVQVESLKEAKIEVEVPKNPEPVFKETREDPIVKLIKSQEPLSYQVGEKMSKNSSNVELDKVRKSDLAENEAKNEMRKKREVTEEELLSSLDNLEMRSLISRDLKAIDDET